MASVELTYDYYANTYGGAASEEMFTTALHKARCRLAAVIQGEIRADVEDAYRMALCAVIDRVAQLDTRGAIASESVGSTSVSYSSAVQSMTDYDAVYGYLSGTGLLYRGVC